jgi:hypothetical protein
MRKYCRAYYLKDLRQFSTWGECCEKDEAELPDDTIVYLWDDFSVIKSPIVPADKIFQSAVTPEWQEFCLNTLHFQIPEDFQYAYDTIE